MPDIYTKAKRSAVMAAIKSQGNKGTELRLVSLLRKYRLNGWRRHQKLAGNPDFVFRKERLALFVDGCFWHGCTKHGRNPGSNQAYWQAKLARNRARDQKISRLLRASGWHVLRLWEHDLKREGIVASRILGNLGRSA